eukprot:516793-Amorphochlora_amoeboformis.AAC.1
MGNWVGLGSRKDMAIQLTSKGCVILSMYPMIASDGIYTTACTPALARCHGIGIPTRPTTIQIRLGPSESEAPPQWFPDLLHPSRFHTHHHRIIPPTCHGIKRTDIL